MRLINVITLGLEEFFGDEIPQYAILSHTWVDGEEVTFQEFPVQKEKAENGGRTKPGWDKITRIARLAQEDDHQYVWIDTCCIDKTSSAELTEAINSMMGWYERSQVCYTYLRDVPSGLGHTEREKVFRESRWFTRGWTLQELLAPSKLIFIFADWSRYATRDEMVDLVSSITGIDTKFLHSIEEKETYGYLANNIISTPFGRSLRARLNSASVAQRMSWASNRRTTRVEDIAYCLLGIFDINMPMLYGEGPKAFLRLQEQIMMCSDDQSILAWNFEGLETNHAEESTENWFRDFHRQPRCAGFFATSPSAFSTCRSIERVNIGKPTLHSLITNKGLRLELPLGSSTDRPYAFLQCRDKYAPASVVALPLKPTPEGFYVRARLPLQLVDYHLLLESRPTELYALKYGDYITRWESRKEVTVRIRSLPKDIEILHAWSQSGNLGPYSQIIIQSDGQPDKKEYGALLLGDRSSGKAKVILFVGLQKGPITPGGSLKHDRLFALDGVDNPWLDSRDFSHSKAQRQPYSDGSAYDLWRLLKKARSSGSTVVMADRIYSTSYEIQDCFGKPVISVDVYTWPRPFGHAEILLRRTTSRLRNHLQGYSGFNKIVLLLVLAPRFYTVAVELAIELLARKAAKVVDALRRAAYPWYMIPFVTDYVFLGGGDSPRFLASALSRPRKESLQALKQWGTVGFLSYLSCKLVGSDTVLEKAKKILASKK